MYGQPQRWPYHQRSSNFTFSRVRTNKKMAPFLFTVVHAFTIVSIVQYRDRTNGTISKLFIPKFSVDNYGLAKVRLIQCSVVGNQGISFDTLFMETTVQ